MQVKRTQLSDTQVRLSVVADQSFIDGVKMVVLRHLSVRHAKIPGFRAGKAPLPLVEKHVDQSLLQTEFLDEAINRLYKQAVQVEKLHPVDQPKVTIKKFVPFTNLEFDAEVEIVGNIKLADYKKLKKRRANIEVTTKDVNEVIKGLQQRMAERTVVARASKADDEVTIDFKGTDDKGRPVNGTDGKDYPLVLGSNTFIPGFEPHMIGLKAGEEKTFTITFPKDYSVTALQNKKVTFWVKVSKVQEMTDSKVDDVFAAKAGPFKTISELRSDIKKQLKVERQQQADREYENALVQEIAQKTEMAIPEMLINDQVLRAEQAERQNLAYRGQTWEEHLAEEGVTEDEHRKRNRPTAEESVKAGLALSEIAELEGLTVAPQELEARLQLLRSQYTDKTMKAELDKPANRQDIEARILTEKTVAKLVEYAK